MDEVVYPKFRWYILVTMIICTATTAIGLIGPQPLQSDIKKSMPQYDAGQITLITMSSFNAFVALSAFFGGMLLDKFGVIKVFIGGIISIAIGSFLVFFIGDTALGLVIVRLFQGIGTGPIMASSAPLAAAYFPHKERSIVTGFQGFSVALGVVLGLSIMPRLAAYFGDWHKALMMTGPLGIVGIILAIIIAFGPKPPQAIVEKTQEEHEAGIAHAFKKALAQPVTWVAIGAYFCMSWIFQAFNDLTPSYIALDPPTGLGLGSTKGGDYLVLAQIVFMGGSILGGIITDKVFKGSGRPIMATGFFFGAIFSFLIKYVFITGNAAVLIFCLTCCGLFFSFVNPQAVGYIAKTYPKEITGKLGGLATGISIFGGWAAPTVGGLAVSATGRYMMSINMLTAMCVIGFLIALFLAPKKDQVA
jgi:MFS family permease